MINPHNPLLTHEESIAEHLKKHGRIDRAQAFRLCGCEDLKGTLSDLRAKGWLIATRRVTLTHYEFLRAPEPDR